MRETRRTDFLFPFATVLSDAVAIEGAFVLAYIMRTRTTLFERFGFLDTSAPPFSAYLLSSLIIIPVWLLLFHGRAMYRPRRNVALSDEFLNIVKVITLGMMMALSAAFFYRGFSYSRIIFLLVWVGGILFVLIGRSVVGAIERRLYRKGRELKPTLLIGNGKSAEEIFERLHGHQSFGFTVIGYCADEPATPGSPLAASTHLGTYEDVPDLIRDRTIELVFIAASTDGHARLARIVQQCEGINVAFMMVPDLLGVLTSNVRIQELQGIPFLRVKDIPLTVWGRILKRAFDVGVSALLLVLLLPLWIVVAAAIKLTSPGPVFFRQERVGLVGKPFMMLKFRSMRIDAEEESGPVWAAAHDPRRTPIGVFLRKTSIDELPQLINVLKGDMSLVGPRPERQFFVDKFKSMIPQYLDRHRVKTGMTGWAQVNDLRGDTSLEERIKYDLYYVENWSFAFDLKILLRTIHTAMKVRKVH